jgi:hypothetical protein
MSEVVRKVFIGFIASIATVGVFLNYQLQIQAREVLLLQNEQRHMGKRLDTQEAGMAELRSMLRGMETAHRNDFDALRLAMNDIAGKFVQHSQFELKIEGWLKELMVWKDQSIEKGMKP